MKRQRRLYALLLAGMMACVPAMQSAAAISYDVSADSATRILFPGDSITNIYTAVTLDDQDVALEEGITWTNHEEDRAYRAKTLDDGSIALSEAGYLLTMKGGTSKGEDEGDSAKNHYKFPEGEQPEDTDDLACYKSGAKVTVKAEEPEAGMQFAGWSADAEEVVFEDPASAETTFVMPEKKVTVTATFAPVPAEEPAEAPADGGEIPVSDGSGEAPADGGEVPVSDGSGEVPADGGADVPVSDGSEDIQIGEPTDGSEDIQIGEPTDGNGDIQIGDNGGAPADGGNEIVLGGDDSAAQDGSDAGVSTYNVTVNHGTASSASGAATFGEGELVTVTANDRSGEGLVFDGWWVESLNAPLDNPANAVASFTMPAADVVVTANYKEAAVEAATYEVIVNDGTGSASYAAGDTVEAVANDYTAEGMAFSGWTVDNGSVVLSDPASATVSFMMAEEPVTLSAHYDLIPQTYNVTVNNGVLADGTASAALEAGTAVTVTANDRTAENLSFSGWYVDSQNVTLDDVMAQTLSFTMPESDVTITATYTENVAADDGGQGSADPADGTASADGTGNTDNTASADGAASGDGSGNAENVTPADGSGSAENTTPADGNTTPADGSQDGGTTTPADGNTTPEDGNTTPADGNTTPGDANGNTGNTTPTDPSGNITITPGENTDNTPAEPTTPETQPPVQQYDVTVAGGAGSAKYAAGADVTIEAQTPAGQQFVKWTADSDQVVFADAAQAVTTFKMPAANVTVTAQYTAARYGVTLQNAADGNGAAAAEYAENDVVTIRANDPQPGQQFDHWEGTVTKGTETSALTFTDAKAQTTTFAMPAGTVTVNAVYSAVPATYLVTVANGLIGGTTTQLVCAENTEITVTANPSPYGQKFSKWSVNNGAYDLGDAAYSQTVTVKVTQNMSFLAQYEGIQYKVKVKDGWSNYTECVVGTVVTIAADDAPEGMKFDGWFVDSGNVSLADANSETTTFTMPDANVTVSAKYKQIAFKVSVKNGTTDQEYYHAGDKVTVKSNYPASGREFSQWTTTSGKVSFADASRWKTSFTMPASNVVVEATYKDGPSTDNNTILDLVAGGEYYTGDTIKFTASGAGMDNSNPNPGDYRYRPSGYQISNVTGTWSASPYTTSMAINATGEYTLKVVYNRDTYNGESWVSDGVSDTKSVTFRVVTKAAGVATGDDTPVQMVIAIAAISCVLFVLLLAMFIVRRKKRK